MPLPLREMSSVWGFSTLSTEKMGPGFSPGPALLAGHGDAESYVVRCALGGTAEAAGGTKISSKAVPGASPDDLLASVLGTFRVGNVA